MNRVAMTMRVGAVASLLVGALLIGRVALPDGVAACSCVPKPVGAAPFTGQEQAVFIGTAGQPDPLGPFVFLVEAAW